MWHLEIQFNGGPGGVQLLARLRDNLRDLFQPK